MKNHIRTTLISLCFIILGFSFSNATSLTQLYSSTENVLLVTPNQYSWAPASGAINYKVTIVDTNTSETTELETTDTSISLLGLPVGNYSIKVVAEMNDGSSSIIIEDVLDF